MPICCRGFSASLRDGRWDHSSSCRRLTGLCEIVRNPSRVNVVQLVTTLRAILENGSGAVGAFDGCGPCADADVAANSWKARNNVAAPNNLDLTSRRRRSFGSMACRASVAPPSNSRRKRITFCWAARSSADGIAPRWLSSALGSDLVSGSETGLVTASPSLCMRLSRATRYANQSVVVTPHTRMPQGLKRAPCFPA
jgi:hypothetical protein